MEMKMSDVLNAFVALKEFTQVKMEARLAFKIAVLLRTLEAFVSPFEEQRKRLISEVKDNSKTVETADLELEQTLEEMVNPDIKPLSIDMLGTINATPAQILALGQIVVETSI